MICEDCGAEFTEMEQTRSDYRDGKCPYCGSERIRETSDDVRESGRATENDTLPCPIG